MITLVINEPIPSQNQSDREHWSIKHRRKKRFESQLKMDLLTLYKKGERNKIQSRPKFAEVHIHSQRKRRILDHANLVGGAKGFVDALVNLDLIYDDADQYVSITYTQKTGKPYYTQVTIDQRED